MNAGRFLASAAAVWLVRVALNWTFYTRVIGQQSHQIAAAHPGLFREVVPGFILTDLIFAFVFTYLFVKVGAALGGGRMAGVKLGLLVAVDIWHELSRSRSPMKIAPGWWQRSQKSSATPK